MDNIRMIVELEVEKFTAADDDIEWRVNGYTEDAEMIELDQFETAEEAFHYIKDIKVKNISFTETNLGTSYKHNPPIYLVKQK